jgi:CelD/BcsL family acetyltransferase involved in cellulose biosynthesis
MPTDSNARTKVQSQHFSARLQVFSRPLPPIDELRPLWIELQSRSNTSFFVSWGWIESWLLWLPRACAAELIEVHDADSRIALAIFVRSKQTRARGLIRTRSLHLHATGNARLDELTIEYNGLLAQRRCEAESANAIAAFLCSNDRHWDEVFFDGIDPSFLPVLPNPDNARLVNREVPVYLVELQAARQSKNGYLGLIGSNTRYQIKSSLRHFEKQGPIDIVAANSVAQALEFLTALKVLQAPRWNERGRESSFEIIEFEQFHRTLITRQFESGCIQILKITVGTQVLGYLYNFVHHGTVLHYQVGIDYQRFGGHYSPGLVANRLAIELNSRAGHHRYNFLAGDVLYKRRLSTHSERLVWTVLRRNRIRFRIEEYLTQSLRRIRSKSA